MGSYKSKIAFEVCIISTEYKTEHNGHNPSFKVIMYDEQNNQSPTFTLTTNFESDAEGLKPDRFTVDYMAWCSTKVFGLLSRLEFWLVDDELIHWHCEKVIIRDRRKGLSGKWEYSFFPVFKWIKPGYQYVIYQNGTFLPSDEPAQELRQQEVMERKSMLQYFQRHKGFPMEVKSIPNDEIFESDNRWNIEPMKTEVLWQNNGLTALYNSTDSWESVEELLGIYRGYNITEPRSLRKWIKTNSDGSLSWDKDFGIMKDLYFGAQRLRGCNPFVIKVCSSIPDNFGVSDEWLKPYLEGWTVGHILHAKRFFIVDFRIMGGIECKKNRTMCAPIALFFFTEKRQLQPLAIQLKQEITEGNPVFIHTDNPDIWFQAKLWFNMVDACHHLIIGRLLPHLILEGIYVAFRRNIAQSHPLYILMAPHFEHILPVNQALKDAAFSSDGWIFRNIQLTKKGIRLLLRRGYKEWRFDINAMIHRELESRGVYESTGLSLYPYRDDGLLIYKCINSYVSKYCQYYYPNGRAQLLLDSELQGWRRECCASFEEGGLGLEGVPGNNAFTNTDDLVRFLVGVLHLLIVQPAATRVGAFDEYGLPLNYPLHLNGSPPEDPLPSENDQPNLMEILPNKHHSLDTLLSIRMSSKLRMRALGDYRTEYIHDPKAKEFFAEFKQRLMDVSNRIKKRNMERDENFQYSALDPAMMSNFPGV